MDAMMSPCGLDCFQCDAYVATRKSDRAALAAIAEKWNKVSHGSFTADTARCHGCRAKDGVQISHCAECTVRLCAIGKDHSTCAECSNFGCETLQDFYRFFPDAKRRLEALRRG